MVMLKKFTAICVAACSVFAVSLCGCKKDDGRSAGYSFDNPYSFDEYHMLGNEAFGLSGTALGTRLDLHIADKDNFADKAVYARAVGLWNDVCDLIADVNDSISTTLETSAIYKFNAAEAGATVQINEIAYRILSEAKSVYSLTGGYYNPAVYQSAEIYGFPSGERVQKPSKLPDAETIEACRALSANFDKLELSESSGGYYARKPSETVTINGEKQTLKLDLGGIGKGWCADRVHKMIEDAGFKYGYFSFGGSSMSVLKRNNAESDSYTTVVRDPRDSSAAGFCRITLQDTDMSSSGDYERFYEIDGVRYCHIIDPSTGSPIQTGTASVTVIGGSAAEDDALTTALSAMGRQKAVEFINAHLAGRKVIMLFVSGNGGEIITNCPDEITVTNTAYKIANTVEDGKIVLQNVA